MVEIQQLIIKGRINGSLDSTDNDLLKIVNDQIEKYLVNYNTQISEDQLKVLIEEITESVLSKIETDLKS